MTALFRHGPDLVVSTRDGRNCVLVEEKQIMLDDNTRYRMPVGAPSDGASIPQPLWSTGLAPFGSYWAATYAHDCAYQDTLEVYNNGEWVKASLTRAQSDELCNALMISLGVPELTRLEIFKALEHFGQAAFDADRRKAAGL